jgi:two-component system sensor kinase FixL
MPVLLGGVAKVSAVKTGHQWPHPGLDERDAAVSRLAAIVESSSDAIVSKDLGGTVTSWNRAAELLLGYSAKEIIGQPITVIFPPDRVDEEAAILEKIVHGDRVERYKTIRRHKGGRLISVSVTVSPIRDSEGTVVGASTIIQDLSEREAQDRRIRELQSELTHVQRLTELGQVVSALVHEVNQPLTAIGNYVGACRRLLTSGKQEQLQRALTRIGDQTDRARQIAQRIREFVKKGETRMRAENLSQVINEIVDLTEVSVRQEGLRITTHIDPTASVAEIDKVQVHQVMFNLMRNAIEAMQGQSRPELAVVTRPTEGGMLEISIADRGPGLPDEVREKLFQPFVTTKPTGMGIGLSVCHGIIQTHGGRLWAEDNPGGGTVFRFTLRCAALESRNQDSAG